MRTLLLLAAAVAAGTFALPLPARPRVELEVIDRDHDAPLAQYRHRGEAWIAGTPGHRYSVRLTNTSGERVLVVLSVDGVNAVSGETADPAQAGYVLAPWQSTEIAGWRKSYEDVAQFVFTDLPDSYAARTGRPFDVGVIGIAVFTEAPRPQPRYEHAPAPVAQARGAAKTAAPPEADAAAAAESSAPQGLGTGHGDREWSPVSRTEFVRASQRPAQISALRYDDHTALAARGIVPGRYRHAAAPRAFPGFVADPPPRW